MQSYGLVQEWNFHMDTTLGDIHMITIQSNQKQTYVPISLRRSQFVVFQDFSYVCCYSHLRLFFFSQANGSKWCWLLLLSCCCLGTRDWICCCWGTMDLLLLGYNSTSSIEAILSILLCRRLCQMEIHKNIHTYNTYIHRSKTTHKWYDARESNVSSQWGDRHGDGIFFLAHTLCSYFAQELDTLLLSSEPSFWIVVSLAAGVCVHKLI